MLGNPSLKGATRKRAWEWGLHPGMPGSDTLGELSSLRGHQQQLLLLEPKWGRAFEPRSLGTHWCCLFASLSPLLHCKASQNGPLHTVESGRGRLSFNCFLWKRTWVGLGWGLEFCFWFFPLSTFFSKTVFPCWLGFSFSLNCSQNFSLLLCWGYHFMLEIWWQFQFWGFPSECLCPAVCDPLRVLLQWSMTPAWLENGSTVTRNTQDTQKQDFSFCSAVGSVPWDISLHCLTKPYGHHHRMAAAGWECPRTVVPVSSADESRACLGWLVPRFVLLQVNQSVVSLDQ